MIFLISAFSKSKSPMASPTDIIILKEPYCSISSLEAVPCPIITSKLLEGWIKVAFLESTRSFAEASLDSRFGSHSINSPPYPLTASFFILGALAGFLNIYRVMRRLENQ